VPGDLLEIEGWWFIEDGSICADFLVTWWHPEEGIGGVYRCGGAGYDPSGVLGPEQLAGVVEHTVLGEATVDFAHHGAHFARDLRITPRARHDGPADVRGLARRTTVSTPVRPRLPGPDR
jgi:hypothetical protein